MTAINTVKFRTMNAKKFMEQMETSAFKNMYLFISKSDPWTNDISPDLTKDTVFEDLKRRTDMLALKKIQPSNVSHAIPRFDYDTTGNTKYLPYSPVDENLYSHPTPTEITDANAGSYKAGSFYVMTEELNVYKCLFQPKDNLGVPKKSTVQPTGRATTSIKTGDGYIWKYLYTVSASEALKYMTDDWMPVKTLAADDGTNQWAVQAAAIDGAIDVIKVTNAGVGYDYTFAGNPQTIDSTTSMILPSSASAIDQAYQNGTIFVDSGPGAGTFRKITGYVGSTKRLTIDSAWTVGSEPTSASIISIVPSVVITGDGSGAVARATVTAGKITEIDMVTRGGDTGGNKPYRYATAVIQGCYNSGASGATVAQAEVVIGPIGGHGKDAVAELGGFFVIVSQKLKYTEEDFPAANDYRRIGLIANVQTFAGAIASATNLSAVHTLSIDSVSGTFVPDEIITSSGSPVAQAKVIEFASTGVGTGTLKYFQDQSTGFNAFAALQTITGAGGATASITALNNPEIKKFSGDIIYAQNRRPIMRAEQQIEDLRLVVEF